MRNKRCIVTGGCGFIGSALVRHLVKNEGATVLVIDKLTYAGVPESLTEVAGSYEFLKADICDQAAMDRAFETFRPDTIFHLAAESHVDRSIDGPGEFIRTNVVGTATLLQSALAWWRQHPSFIFQHISTDEVYGSLGPSGYFTEKTPYAPHSPYSASKASSDHLVRAWHDTYGLPTLITNCSNNYGPYHFPEKLIPLVILNCLDGKPLPVYGKGANVRDWLYVDDHVRALCLVNEKGCSGETYNVGGHNERPNIFIVKTIIEQLHDRLQDEGISEELIKHVEDRLGHDRRYGIDPTKIKNDLGWYPETPFEQGIVLTIDWYLANEEWMNNVTSGNYQKYYEDMYKNK